MNIIGVDFSIPATIYVNTETGEVITQKLGASEMAPTDTFRDADGRQIAPSDETDRALNIASGEPDADGVLPDYPGWDWQ